MNQGQRILWLKQIAQLLLLGDMRSRDCCKIDFGNSWPVAYQSQVYVRLNIKTLHFLVYRLFVRSIPSPQQDGHYLLKLHFLFRKLPGLLARVAERKVSSNLGLETCISFQNKWNSYS